MTSVILLLTVLIALASGAAYAVYRLSRPVRMPRNPEQWLERMSAQGYRPVVRLLSREDWEFVNRHAGASTELKARFRRERRTLVRQYLNAIEVDFQRIHELLRQTLLAAKEDRPDLVQFLVRERARFTMRVWQVRIRLVMDWMGVDSRDLKTLLGSVESMAATAREVRFARSRA